MLWFELSIYLHVYTCIIYIPIPFYVFIQATSLGGVESLIEHRASVEGPDTKTPQNLIRVSVGLENSEDLIEDLNQALNQIIKK